MTKDPEFVMPKYGSLEASRRQARKAYVLVNLVCARFGSSICWDSRTRFNSILRPGKKTLFFKFHGNRFAPIVEFLSEDFGLLQDVKQAFVSDFPMHDVEVKEGFLE